MKSNTIISGSEQSSHWKIVYFTLFISLVAMFGSLFFSEVMKLPPCILCWYQRIAMYPIVPVLILGVILQDRRVSLYVLTLSVSGFVIAIYHNLLYYHIIPESLSPCIQGISCTSRQIEWFGFVTIPLLALTAFTLITLLMIIFLKRYEIKGAYK